jgi:GNAT superfamily N-acetyltransferase
VELVYFGLVPEARGAGYGEWLIRWAQYVAREAGRERIVLAVDARNQPASDTYLRCGFEEWGRRAVWLRLLPSPGKIGE